MWVGEGGICEEVKGVGRKNDQNVCVGGGGGGGVEKGGKKPK